MLNVSVHGADTAPTVVFLHAAGINSWMWEPFLPLLPNIRAVLVDLPGHGDSRDTPWVSLEESAKQVGQVVDDIARGPMHLAALSLGSYVGLHLLAQRPSQFDSAFLSGVHAGGMPGRFKMKVLSALMAPFAVRPFFARKTASMFGVTPEQMQSFVDSATKTRAAAFRRATNDVVDFELPAAASKSATRCLFLAGSNEHDLILSSLAVFESSMPNASTALIEGGGHGWPAKMPDRFAQELGAHLAATGEN